MNFDLKTANRAFEDLKWLSCHGTWPDKKYPEWVEYIKDEYHVVGSWWDNGANAIGSVAWPLIANIFRDKMFQVLHALDDVIVYAENESEYLDSMDDEGAETAWKSIKDAQEILKETWEAIR